MKSDILVVGGGFAGLWAALAAAREIDVHGAGQTVTLVSASPYLTIRPRLYEASPEKLRTPLGPTLKSAGITFTQAEVAAIHPDHRQVSLAMPDGSGQQAGYQRLIVATGSKMQMPPITGMADHCWSIDDYSAAKAFDSHLAALPIQERFAGNEVPVFHPQTRKNKNIGPQFGSIALQKALADDHASNTFVIVGAGFTGVELACEMRDRIAAHHGEPIAQQAEIYLLDKSEKPGAGLGAGPGAEIKTALEKARVQFRGGAEIAAVVDDCITLGTGETIATRTVIATTGLTASLPPGLETMARDDQQRLITNDYLQLNACDTMFAAGDSAYARVDENHHALMSCQHAMPMGRYAGFNAAHDLLGLDMRAYRQPTYQTCLDLGRSGAVLTLGWDREVKKTGAEAGELKRNINTKWIYPPAGSREDIFDAANIDKPPAR